MMPERTRNEIEGDYVVLREGCKGAAERVARGDACWRFGCHYSHGTVATK